MQRAGQFTALGGSDARAAPGASDSGGGKGLDRSRWQRASQEVALRDIAAKIAQEGEDALALDALGDDLEPEVVAEHDGRTNNCLVAGVRLDVTDEGVVDLEDVDRKPLQIAERGVAAAEVVDREPHAQRAQAIENGARASGR